jgi:hypothetical protein
MSKHMQAVAALGLSCLLTACGGNGGGGTDSSGSGGNSLGGGANVAASAAQAEGAWSGSNSLGNTFDMLLLETGDLYQVYGTPSSTGAFTALGLGQGRYTVSGNSLAAQFSQYNYVGAKLDGTLSATIAAGTSITGSAASAPGANAVTFSAQPTSTLYPSYNYQTPAAISDISGPWISAYLLGQSAPFLLNVDAAGLLSGSNLGCSFTGSITPRGSGKNVFNISIVFGQSPCAVPGDTASGVAFSYLTGSGKRQLIAAFQNPAKTRAGALYAQR